ncbi:MAG: mechanosensitive ion channel family protein [Pseudolabrys sp.]
MTLRAGAFFSALSALLLLTAVAPAASAQVVGLPRVLAAAESGKAAPAAGDKKAAATDAKPAASDSKPAAAPAKAPASAPAKPEPDPFGRETPQGMVSGLMNALAAPDYERALQYFQTDQVPGVPRWYVLSGPRLAERFQQVLDHAGDVVTPAELSSSPSGNVNDGLPQNEERFGEIKADGRKVPLLAVRVKRDGKDLWLVSSKTLSEVPSLARILDVGAPGNSWLSRLPEGPTVFGAPASNWLALLLLAAVSFGFAWALAAQREPIERLLRRGGGETKLSRFIEKSAGPGRLLLALLLFGLALQGLGISVIARYRAMFAVQIIGWFAVAWLIWRWSDAAGEVVLSRMSQRGQLSAYSAISFLTRAFKALLAALFLAALLRAFGVNVTAGLAALGVGGLAVALGAQKLFENLIGSLTVLADRPVRVGDFCRFGSTLGTVEEIGIRSTRIRTLDRTVLTVPNGEFATLHIENYSQRDRFWFHPIINLRYETSTDQMRYVLQELRAMLSRHPKVDSKSMRVRLIGLGAYSLDVEIFAYVSAWDYASFLEIQEELLLSCMQIVEASGTGFAFPSSTLYLGRDGGLDEKRTRAAEIAIRTQREEAAE